MKWRLYWAGLGVSLFGLAFWRNNRLYSNESRAFRVWKSLGEVALTSFLARFVSPLLVTLCAFWTMQQVQRRYNPRPVWNVVVAVVSSMFYGFLASQFLEVILILGVGGVIGQITNVRRDCIRVSEVAA